MVTDKESVMREEERFKCGIQEMIERRHFKDIVARLIWLRDQKQLAVDANLRRVKKFEHQIVMLEEMVEEEEAASKDGR